MKLDLTKREASVVLDVLLMLVSHTGEDMREELGWNKTDKEAWATALRKVDDALVGRR